MISALLFVFALLCNAFKWEEFSVKDGSSQRITFSTGERIAPEDQLTQQQGKHFRLNVRNFVFCCISSSTVLGSCFLRYDYAFFTDGTKEEYH